VLALLGLGAVGLSARDGLDWDTLTTAPESGWVGVLLGGAALGVLALALRRLLTVLASARDDDEERPALLPPERITWPAWLLSALLLAGTVLLVWFLVEHAIHPAPDLSGPPGLETGDGGGPADRAQPADPLPLVLGLAAVLVAVLTWSRWRASRPLPTPATGEGSGPGPDDDGELAGAVAAAERALGGTDDVRAAILSAYAAMEQALARAGTPARESDTPSDLLERAVRSGRVSDGAARRLTDLFREARFSRHRLPPTARADAERALARVADELGRTRA
jgi:hypothetical protein